MDQVRMSLANEIIKVARSIALVGSVRSRDNGQAAPSHRDGEFAMHHGKMWFALQKIRGTEKSELTDSSHVYSSSLVFELPSRDAAAQDSIAYRVIWVRKL